MVAFVRPIALPKLLEILFLSDNGECPDSLTLQARAPHLDRFGRAILSHSLLTFAKEGCVVLTFTFLALMPVRNRVDPCLFEGIVHSQCFSPVLHVGRKG